MNRRIPFISLVEALILAVPFWICWTFFGLGEKYFAFLPEIYRSIPFLDTAGLFIAISILKGVLVPKFASVHNHQDDVSR